MLKNPLLLAVVVFSLGSLVWSQDAGKKSAGVQKKTYAFKDAGKDMEYALFVPSTYEKDKKSPLIIALHGLGSKPQEIIRYPGLTDQAEKHGYIVAAPMGYNSSGWYGSKGLKSAKTTPENLGELSEKDVMNVLALVRKDYSVDDKRIYLMGHSMGGAGTFHLGRKYPDIWAGLAPIAPAVAVFGLNDFVDKIKHIPVIVIQGDADKLVPVTGVRRWTDKMKKLDMKYEYIEVAGGGHVDVAFKNMPKVFEFFNKHQKKMDK
jgi:poly(3-hydroxybutyrate) depolymerase